MTWLEQLATSQGRLRDEVQTFVTRAGHARLTFVRGGQEASAELVSAGRGFLGAAQDEAKHLTAALPEAPRRAQAHLLIRIKGRLGEIDEVLSAQLERLTAPRALPTLPIKRYDQLTAKEIVAKLAKLAPEKKAVVAAYERATKKRATILKAAS